MNEHSLMHAIYSDIHSVHTGATIYRIMPALMVGALVTLCMRC